MKFNKNFNKIKLKNGLVVLHEKRDVDVTTVMLGARFGGVYESEEDKGVAHFIEHLCFKGTKKRSAEDIAFELERVGGILNAFTSEELTAYHVKLPSDYLELAMDVIFDIFFNPVFPEKDVKKEGNVICEEIKMYRDNPQLHSLDKIKELLYKKGFGMSLTGTKEGIMSMTRDGLLEKHRGVYCPENSILCVVGNNDFEDVVKFAEKFSVDRKMEKVSIEKIELKNSEEKEVRKEMHQANVVLGFHFPKIDDKERHAAEVFSTILGHGMSSKLFREVREKRGLAYAVKSDLDIGKNYGYLIIYIGTDKSKVDEVKKICLDEFGKMGDLSEKELEDGKKQVIGNYDIATEDSANVALNLILEEMAGGAEKYYDYEKNLNEVSLEDIRKLASQVGFSSFVVGP